MSGGGGAIKGYWYSLGIHMGICRGPVNSIVETRVGDKPVLPIFLEITDSVIFPLYNPGLFGGTDGEGGIAGPMNVMMGKDDQLCPPELALMNFPTPQPGFRRICSVFFDGFVAAINPYPKPWTFRVRRTTKGWDGDPWYPEKAMIELTRPFSPSEITSTPIIHAMNPAHIFYEVMTNREWGRGLPRAALDDANLRAVADTLYAEGFGMCLYWSRSDDIETFVQSILDHIGAVLRPNLTTGELQLKLLRKDYVVADLPLFDNESGLLDITEASVAAMPTIINHCKVTFKDPITGKDGSVGTHNLAGVKGSNGEINTLEKSYPGLPTPDLAARVALRDLRASSNALRRFSVTLDRRGQDVQPGDVIRVRDMTRGIGEVVVRIGKYEEGNNLDGRITLSAVQDIFRMTPTSFTGNQPPTWEAPNTSPCIGYNRSFEMPYFMLAHTMSAADLDYLGDDTGFLGEVVELGGRPMNAGYKIATRIGLPTEDDLPDVDTSYCPTVPANWDGGDCVLITGGEATLIVQGTTNDEGEIPGFPGLYEWHSVDAAVTYPTSGVATVNPVYPGWGPVATIDTVEDGTHWAESSIAMFFTPSAAAVLGASFELNMYDVTDGDALFYTTTMYRGGGTYSTEIDVAMYAERPVANCSNTIFPWPEYPLNDLPQVPSPYLGRDGHVIRYEMGSGEKIVSACCVCLEIRMSGVPALDPTLDPMHEQYLCYGTIIVPSSLENGGDAPGWGAEAYALNPDGETFSYADNTLKFAFGPTDSPFLTDVLTCKVYDDSDGGALVYETVVYKAGSSIVLPYSFYLERPVANIVGIAPEYPLIHSSPPPNPAVALAGHNLRFVLSTASTCCGGLPPETFAKMRVSGMMDADSAVWINTGVVDTVAATNGPWMDSVTRIAKPGFDTSTIFELALFDADGDPLPEGQQATWSAVASDGSVVCLSNAAVSNPDGIAGGYILSFGGGTSFNRTVTATSSLGHVFAIEVHYPNPTITQTVVSAYGGPPSLPDYPVFGTDGFGTGSIVSDSAGSIVSADLQFTAVAHPYECGKGTVNMPFWVIGATATFAPSGVGWIDDSVAFELNKGGIAENLVYYSNLYISISGTDDGCTVNSADPDEVVISATEGNNSLVFVNFAGHVDLSGQNYTLPNVDSNPAHLATPTIS